MDKNEVAYLGPCGVEGFLQIQGISAVGSLSKLDMSMAGNQLSTDPC
jgi:hypothetical protein